MKKILLILTLFLFSGCSLDQLFIGNEINKVYVVKHSRYVKHHRGYFTRTDLIPIFGKQKYLFLYNAKKDDLGLLLHRKSHYLLYSFSYPGRSPISISDRRIKSRRSLLRAYARYGYHLKTPLKVGYLVSVKPRIYKGVKTYMVESKNYRKLQQLYRQAIKHYDPSKIRSVRTPLPKVFISSYLIQQYRTAKSERQLAALEEIAAKLHIQLPQKKGRHVQKKESSEEIEPLYPYYLHYASMKELERYLNSKESQKALTSGQYALLEHRLEKLKQQKLMKEGTLEELIEAYHENKDPKLKKRIMERIKEIRGY